jgi:putative tryptophan/tyrosine transport system substrate-binding protein
MRRRTFISLVGGAAVASPLVVHAQQPTIPRGWISQQRFTRSICAKPCCVPPRGLGQTGFANSLGAKRFELLRELVPTSKLIAVMANPTTLPGNADRRDVEAAARAVGQRIIVLEASSESDFEPAFTAMVRQRVDALLIMADPFFNSRRKQLVALVAQHAIPAVYEWREFAEAGGLMSYGSSITEAQRQIGLYTGQILKGTKPADLPFQQAVKIELIINLKTAKTLGLTFPITLLGRADEVIE